MMIANVQKKINVYPRKTTMFYVNSYQFPRTYRETRVAFKVRVQNIIKSFENQIHSSYDSRISCVTTCEFCIMEHNTNKFSFLGCGS